MGIINILILSKLVPSLCVRNRLYTSEYDVCRRQILMYKDGPRSERVKLPGRNVRGSGLANVRCPDKYQKLLFAWTR